MSPPPTRQPHFFATRPGAPPHKRQKPKGHSVPGKAEAQWPFPSPGSPPTRYAPREARPRITRLDPPTYGVAAPLVLAVRILRAVPRTTHIYCRSMSYSPRACWAPRCGWNLQLFPRRTTPPGPHCPPPASSLGLPARQAYSHSASWGRVSFCRPAPRHSAWR